MKTTSLWIPIIPDRMIWTSSSLRLFRRCKRKFFWKYIMRLSPIYRDRHLMFGGAFHEGVAKWYRAKRVSIDMIASGITTSLRTEVEQSMSYYDQSDYEDILADIEAVAGILRGYTEHYANDKVDWDFDRDMVEASFIVDMGDFDYAGQIDAVGSDFLVEHKTASNPNASYFDRLVLDTQIRGYVYAAKREFSNRISKVHYNVVRKPKLRRKAGESHEEYTNRIRQDYLDRPSFYFNRVPLDVTKNDLVNFERELRQTHAEYVAIVKNGWFNKPEAWTPNDSECNAFFRLCPYFAMCASGLAGGAAFVKRRETMHEELKDLE